MNVWLGVSAHLGALIEEAAKGCTYEDDIYLITTDLLNLLVRG